MHPWHPDGKGGQPGTKMMIENGVEVPEDWGWTQTPGSAMRFCQAPARPAVETSNSFTALASEESGDIPPPEPSELRREKQSRVAGTSMAAEAAAPKPATMLQEDFPELCKRPGVAPRGESWALTMQRVAAGCAFLAVFLLLLQDASCAR